MLDLHNRNQQKPRQWTLSASAWSTPFVLMSFWSSIQLWPNDSLVESLRQDLIMGLIYSSVIAAAILPAINRTAGVRLATGRAHQIIEDTLGCLLVVLSLSVLLAGVLLAQNQYFRDSLHLSIQLTGVVVMANCWILATVLLSSAKYSALITSFLIAAAVLLVAFYYQPLAGLSYNALAWLSAAAAMLLSQARSLTAFLPRPSKISLTLVFSLPTAIELSLASTALCIGLWLSRPSAHSLWQMDASMQLMESSQSIAYLALLPVAMLVWWPLEIRFKSALFAFEQAANGGGNLPALDYQKNNLIALSLSGMQRVYIALIAAAAITLSFNHLIPNGRMGLYIPNWLMALSLVHVALEMVSLCAIRLLFYLQRDRELLLISILHLILIALSVTAISAGQRAAMLSYALVLSSGFVCLVSVGILRRRLQRLDYLFFMSAKKVVTATN